MEKHWRKICLHQVLDYFDKVGHDDVIEKGVRAIYYDTLDECDLYK